MKRGFAARRSAEEFNSLVEGALSEGPVSSQYVESLELVTSLRESAPVEPRAEFVADLRHALMTEATTVLTPTAARLTVTPRRSPRERRIAIAIGGFAVVSATTSMAMAAQTSLPGDTLYPLKRALENASTTIQLDEDGKGTSMLAHAAGRLDEVDELTRKSDGADAKAVADTLYAFAAQASSASDLLIAAYTDKGEQSDIEELRTFTAQSMAAINQLETAVPETARAALIEAAQVINLIDTKAITLCPTCGEGGAQLPTFTTASAADALGDLGQALTAPLTRPTPDHTPGEGQPNGPAVEESPGPADGSGEPDPDPDFPVAPDGSTTPNSGPATSGGNGPGGSGRPNVIKDLTDRLTGGDKDPDTNPGNIGDVIDDALDDIVQGLLG